MAWFKPSTLLDKTYEIGILIKGIDGVLELIGGILVLVVPPKAIDDFTTFLTQSELGADPHNFLAEHLAQFGHELAHSSHLFAAVFLLTHGLVKVILVGSLLRNYHWAYPFALLTLGAFIVYQLYVMVVQPTWGMAFLTVLDVVIVWLIWREWGQQKRRWAAAPEASELTPQ